MISNSIDFLFKILSQIVVKTLEIMFTVKAISKIYPACQTDDNGIKPGSDLNNADKRDAEPSRAEVWGIKEYVFDV